MSAAGERRALLIAAEARGVRRFAHEAMACTWGVWIADESEAYARQAAEAAFAEIDRLEQELSRFVETSDIARLNAQPAGRPLRIGPDAFACLELAARLWAETAGAFDVTIGGLVDRACDGEGSAAPAFGMDRLTIERAARTVAAKVGGVCVDLGGIGKGFAIDRAVELLGEWGIERGLVHSGQSTVYAIGSSCAERRGWSVSMRDPGRDGAVVGEVRLEDRALSGSGTLLHGRHIIDPRSGGPADTPRGAWAVAESAAVSDALSTAFMILAAGEIEVVCERRRDVSGLVLEAAGTGERLRRFGRGGE